MKKDQVLRVIDYKMGAGKVGRKKNQFQFGWIHKTFKTSNILKKIQEKPIKTCHCERMLVFRMRASAKALNLSIRCGSGKGLLFLVPTFLLHPRNISLYLIAFLGRQNSNPLIFWRLYSNICYIGVISKDGRINKRGEFSSLALGLWKPQAVMSCAVDMVTFKNSTKSPSSEIAIQMTLRNIHPHGFNFPRE